MRRIFSRSKARDTIEKEAFAAMRKAKSLIDPSVLAKVKQAIENSPMGAQIRGMQPKPITPPQQDIKKPEIVTQKPVVLDLFAAGKDDIKKQKALVAAKMVHDRLNRAERIEQDDVVTISASALTTQRSLKIKEKAADKDAIKPAKTQGSDKISVDRAKMLDIVAKTLALNPHKNALKQGVKDILSKE